MRTTSRMTAAQLRRHSAGLVAIAEQLLADMRAVLRSGGAR